MAVAFEPSASKVVPVVPAVEGEPAEGYVVGTVTAQPATVEVVGPESALENLTEAITEPVTVEGASGLVRESVTIGVPDPAVRLREPRSAVVTVNVATAPVEARVGNVPVVPRNGRRGEPTVTPPAVTVVVRGAREVVEALSPDELEASVDLEGLGEGQVQLPVRVTPPQHVIVVRVEPAQVLVRVP